MCTLMSVPCSFDDYSFVISFKTVKGESFHFCFKAIFGYSCFPHECEDQFVDFGKNGSWDFDNDSIEPAD